MTVLISSFNSARMGKSMSIIGSAEIGITFVIPNESLVVGDDVLLRASPT